MGKNNNIYYIRWDQGKRSVVYSGTFEHLKRDVFQNILLEAKSRSTKPFWWPRNIQELIKTLNYCTLILGTTSDFYTLTNRQLAEQKHWPIMNEEEN